MMKHWYLQMLEYEHRSRHAWEAAERNRLALVSPPMRMRTGWARPAAHLLAGLFGLAHLVN